MHTFPAGKNEQRDRPDRVITTWAPVREVRETHLGATSVRGMSLVNVTLHSHYTSDYSVLRQLSASRRYPGKKTLQPAEAAKTLSLIHI